MRDAAPQVIKYGVVELRHLLRDLQGWRHLYISGRMQKPVTTMQSSPQVADAQQQNLRSALTAALLLLPGAFSTEVSAAGQAMTTITAAT